MTVAIVRSREDWIQIDHFFFDHHPFYMDWDDSGDEFSAADESFGTPEVKPLKKAAPSLAPVQKAIKAKAPAPAKPKVPLATQDANSGVSTTSAAPKPSGKKNIEEEYVKMDQREHVLLRPDMYIGAVKKIQDTCWVMEGGRAFLFLPACFAKFGLNSSVTVEAPTLHCSPIV